MDMIRSRFDGPQTPASMIAVFLALRFHNRALFQRQQDDIVFQSFPTPLRQSGLRRLIALSPSSPATLITLQMRAVHSPRNEEGDGFI
jgi:hypothetical protein